MSLKEGNNVAVRLKNVGFTYSEESEHRKTDFSLRGIDLSVAEGEFLAVLGHNGSGKSTLARLIDGLLFPTEGEITVFGSPVKDDKTLFEIRKQVGIVFQNPDNQTVASIVEDDIAFGPENIGVKREEIGERIDFALSAVGMEEYRHAMTNRLSGGQKQRIAIAGALALRPKILILDESTAMLDPKGRREIIDIVRKLNKENGITVVLITHFPEEALLADRAIVLNRGEIVMQGLPNEILKNGELLETYNLTLPRPVRLCQALSKHGILVKDTLDEREIANGILRSLGDKKGRYAPITKKQSEEKPLAVDVRGLSYAYDEATPFETVALKDVSAWIEQGEIVGVIGHTGSGKSTFLQHLNALIKLPTAKKKYKENKKHPKGNTVFTVNGFDLTDKNTDFKQLRQTVGVVFQYPEQQLFAETVFEDVAFGLKNFNSNLSPEETETAVKEALTAVGLDYHAVKDVSPFELSGGQRRRVAIAGVIVSKPKLLVMDEPAAGLDPLGKEQIMSLMQSLKKSWCETVIFVSHDMDEIAENCTSVMVFSSGSLVCKETPEELFSKEDELLKLGLDVPFTAKVCKILKEHGVEIGSDYSSDGFLSGVVAFKDREGGQSRA